MKALAVKNKNLQTRMKSRSGGVFPEIAKEILNLGGTVYGCALDENFVAFHKRVSTVEELPTLSGSKYVQSDKKSIFRSVREDLRDEKKVLFSGTPCEIAGLKAFLQKENTENLLTADIICHGVPSPLIWEKFKSYKTPTNATITEVDFRNKKDFGWGTHIETLTFSDESVYTGHEYTDLFYGHLSLRPSCYHCPYTNLNRVGDFTLGDCWRRKGKKLAMNDNKGLSLLLLNTEKSENVFKKIQERFEVENLNIENFMQRPLKKSCGVFPLQRNLFWKDVRKKSFDSVVRKYGENSLKSRIKRILRCKIFSNLFGIIKKIRR